jgi:hypothetical protein
VEKRRVGRVWEFWTGKGKGRGVEVGEELCEVCGGLIGEWGGRGGGRRRRVEDKRIGWWSGLI